MRIIDIQTLWGPNVHHYKPVLILRLDLEDLIEVHSAQMPGFNERLLAALPGLANHRCVGGFTERLKRGTYLAHIVEHIALELSEQAGIGVGFGKARREGDTSTYQVVVRFLAEEGMKAVLRTAVGLAEGLARNRPFPLDEQMREARRISGRKDLGPSTRAIVDAATKRGIPWMRLSSGSLVQLGYGKKRRLIQATVTDRTSLIAGDIASDKELTKQILRQASIPVPRGGSVTSEEGAVELFREMQGAVVVKPLNGHQGKGVTIGIRDEAHLLEAFRRARTHGEDIVIEERFLGRDYRVLVVDGKVAAVSKREPAHVVGDGSHSIEELIAIENRNPLRGEGHGFPLTEIAVDASVLELLHAQSFTCSSIPRAGERVILRSTANLSTGGIARDVTDQVHPEIAFMCERAARLIGLDICGLDLVIPDISKPIQPHSPAGVIEVNAGPGIRMHHFPSEGTARDVGGMIVDMLFPNGESSRIPVLSITGTNGKTSVTRMIAHVLGKGGKCVGMTTSDGVFIDGKLVDPGDNTGPISARTVLTDPGVDVAVLETARGGIIRRGLAFDWCDVGIITNIQNDHLGQDGMRDLEDVLRVKSLVAERVREGGTVILNADDPMLARLPDSEAMRKIPRNYVFYSMQPDQLVLRRHASAGRTAYYLQDGWIHQLTGGESRKICEPSTLPLTLGGAARFHISNLMAVIAACVSQGVAAEDVATALQSFDAGQSNSGRLNLFKLPQGYVILDYGHNPGAFEAMGEMCRRLGNREITAIVGVPGDRNDEVILECGRAVGRHFRKVILRDDHDRRGRAAGEAPSLMIKGIHAENGLAQCRVILDPNTALTTAIRELAQDEIIIYFFEKSEEALATLKKHGAVPVNSIELPKEETDARKVS